MAIACATLVMQPATQTAAADPARPFAEAAARLMPAPAAPRKTREELLREWDVNSDGRIDGGEAELAASRMRLERARIRLNSGFDPVTGRPRNDPAAVVEPIEKQRTPAELAAELDAATTALPEKPGPQGTPSKPQAPERSAARAPTQRPAPIAGGVRAGGQAARPGYGAAASPSLNAGRPLASSPPANTARPLNAAASARPAAADGRSPGPMRPDASAAAQRPRGGLLPRPPLQPPPRSRDLYDPY